MYLTAFHLILPALQYIWVYINSKAFNCSIKITVIIPYTHISVWDSLHLIFVLAVCIYQCGNIAAKIYNCTNKMY